MPRLYQAVDHVEPVTDTMMEQFGNDRNYHWDSGCELSYSATDLTVTISEGSVTHNGLDVAVAEDTITLVPDANNPLWAHIAINSAGEAVVVHGTAAADPVVPELGDYVELALVKVEAAQVYANACEHKIAKRMKGKSLVTLATGTGATTKTLTADLAVTASAAVVNSLTIALAANTKYLVEAQFVVQATAASGSYHISFYAGENERTMWSADGTAFQDATGFTITALANDAIRIIKVFGSVIATEAADLVITHYGSGRTLKAGSRVKVS